MADQIQELDDNVEQQNSSIGNVSEETDGSLSNKSFVRAKFAVAHTDNFKSDSNPSGWTPVVNEICVDNKGIYSVWGKNERGEMVRLSPLEDFLKQWDELKKLGIINNAEAFRLNGKIYNFIFDNKKMVLRLNTELDIYEEYKYYRVRKTEKNPETGDYIYITGTRNSETGEVLTNFGNIVSINGRMIPSSVAMINSCEDGKSYVVEFFDENRTIIGSQVYYARSGITLDFSLSPDMAISEMIVNTDRPHDEANACFLYQNEDPSSLIIRVGLKYADGNLRDITEEGYTTGRLKFEGRDEIDTSKLTSNLDEAQIIKIIYFIDKDNSKNPSVMDQDTEAALLDPDTISLTKLLKVYIVEDIYDPIIDVTLHGYKETKSGSASDTVTNIYKIKVFAKYESGVMRDITPVMDKTRFLSQVNFEYNSKTKCLETTSILANFVITCQIPQGRSVAMFSKEFSCEFTEYDKKLKVNRVVGGFDAQDTQKNTLFNSTLSQMKICEGETLAQLKEKYSYKYQLEAGSYLVPTHVIIRSGLDPDIIYTGNTAVDSYAKLDDTNGVVSYSIPDNNLILEDQPLLVEFYKIDIDEETGARKSIFLTNMQRTYAKSTSTSLISN